MKRKRIALLGSTGSIGRQALEVLERFPDRFRVSALTAGANWELLASQALKFKPELVAIQDEKSLPRLEEALDGAYNGRIEAGSGGIMQAASLQGNDLVLTALVGVAGLLPTLAALEAGMDIALANKETLVVGGELVMRKAREKGCAILPVDSEHSAIFQCLRGEKLKEVNRIYLTSSGGPFREFSSGCLSGVRAGDALRHPTWKMGNKITIDSATLMNKGFEVLEARWLFGLPLERVEVIVHPQSIIHSMVEFRDGSIKAQMGCPDMRLPIQYALGFPARLEHSWTGLDLLSAGPLTFEAPRKEFRCLFLAREAASRGGTMPAVLNGANEEAVSLFLGGRIGFLEIADLVEKAMSEHSSTDNPSIGDLIKADAWAREKVRHSAGAIKPREES
jgi:1-deoxy-D-xylulose-5-phosphate reductoisomerase